jgi:hypothetical protein
LISPVKELREKLLILAGEHLGSYRRQGFDDIPAIRVMNAPLAKGIEVITASLQEEPLPAIEIVIHDPPQIQSIRPRNFGCTNMTIYGWRIWIVCHESRQSPLELMRSIYEGFSSDEEPRYRIEESILSERTDLNPDFYTLVIWVATTDTET